MSLGCDALGLGFDWAVLPAPDDRRGRARCNSVCAGDGGVDDDGTRKREGVCPRCCQGKSPPPLARVPLPSSPLSLPHTDIDDFISRNRTRATARTRSRACCRSWSGEFAMAPPRGCVARRRGEGRGGCHAAAAATRPGRSIDGVPSSMHADAGTSAVATPAEPVVTPAPAAAFGWAPARSHAATQPSVLSSARYGPALSCCPPPALPCPAMHHKSPHRRARAGAALHDAAGSQPWRGGRPTQAPPGKAVGDMEGTHGAQAQAPASRAGGWLGWAGSKQVNE